MYWSFARNAYLPIAVAASDQFHRRFARGDDGLIYQEADPVFRAKLTEETERAFFSRVRRKLGACSYNGPLGWSFVTNGAGTRMTLTYQCRCANGIVRGVFVWRLTRGSRANLVGFSVNSSALLTD